MGEVSVEWAMEGVVFVDMGLERGSAGSSSSSTRLKMLSVAGEGAPSCWRNWGAAGGRAEMETSVDSVLARLREAFVRGDGGSKRVKDLEVCRLLGRRVVPGEAAISAPGLRAELAALAIGSSARR